MKKVEQVKVKREFLKQMYFNDRMTRMENNGIFNLGINEVWQVPQVNRSLKMTNYRRNVKHSFILTLALYYLRI
jgi:hypothetical protein